jgi:PAS domain S-box-containing protein
MERFDQSNNLFQSQQEQLALKVLAALSYRAGDLRNYLQAIAQGVSDLIRLDWSVVTLCRDGSERILASTIDLGEAVDQVYELHGTLTGRVIQQGCPLIVDDVTVKTEYGVAVEGYKAYLGVPLRTPIGEILGTICSFHKQPRHFTPEEVRLAEIFAERAATAIDNYELYQQQQKFNELLETEVVKRTCELRATQSQLMTINNQLEQRVEQRTAELLKLNAQLQAEITERKAAEEALRQSEERFRALFEHAGDGLFVFDANGHVVDANQRACETLGYTRDELLNLSIPDIRSKCTDEELADIKAQLASRKPITLENFHRRKDGTMFPIEARVRLFEWGGQLLEIALVRDVTQRKQAEEALRRSEEQLRQIAENMKQILWLYSKNEEPIYISPAFEQIWGQSCDRWYRLGSKVWDDAIHPDDRARVLTAIKQAADGNFDEEYRIIRPDSSVRIIHDQAFPIRDDQGQIYRIAGIAEDVTEQRRAQQEMLKAVERLAEVGELAAMIVHEVRNPLTTVMMGLNSFKRMELSDAAQERLDLALEEAERLRSLLNEILLYAKPQTHQHAELELNTFCLELLDTIHTLPAALSRQIRFISAPSPIKVLADRDKLKQVFINLVGNACEAIAQGATVTWRVNAPADQHVCIQVHNGGDPIPPDILPKLTKPFFTTKPTGTGLGLAIVKRIIDAHQGELAIASSAQQGTIFTVKLPIIQ